MFKRNATAEYDPNGWPVEGEIDPGSVYLTDTADWNQAEEGPQDVGVTLTTGQRDFLQHVETMIHHAFHKQTANTVAQAIAKSLQEAHVVRTLPVASDTFATGQEAIPNTNPQRVVDERKTRRQITLVNTGANTVYVDRASSVNTGRSFPVAAGAVMTLSVKGEVWAICAAGQTSTLAYFETFDNE